MIPRGARRILLAVGVVLCGGAALGVPSSSPAQATPEVQGRRAGGPGDSLLEARASAVAAQLRCPVCQGNSIQDSPSELAQEMKGVVREQLASGKSEEEVKRYFVDKYGEWILLEPKAAGFNLLVYLLPVVGIALGAFVIWRSVRRWTAPGDSAGQAT